MTGELLALVDGEIGEGKRGGMILGTGINDIHAVDKMLTMVEHLKTHPTLSKHLTKVTFVKRMSVRPKEWYVHPHIGADANGAMKLGNQKMWFQLILSVDISQPETIDVDSLLGEEE